MELELRFDGLSEDLVDAQADVQLLDLAMADAPADPSVTTVRAFSVSPDRPTVRVTVDLPVAPGGYEPGLAVRVRGRTASDAPIQFFNTRTTPLTDGPVRVVLSRIT